MDWRERYDRAAARYAAGEARELDERQLVQLANAAWAAGLSLLMDGDEEGATDWLRRSAARYRESWTPGSESWGRPIGALKALLIAGDDASDAAEWTLETCLGISYRDTSESPIGRYAGTLALLVLGRDAEAGALAATLGDGFPTDVAAALAALAAGDADAYGVAVASVRASFEARDGFLEDMPVADTALALDALAERRRLG